MASEGKNTGKPYELLVRHIFEQILNQESVKTLKVEHDVNLSGKTTDHQIDVYWSFEVGGVRYETIVQAKDWATPVDKGELILFKGVLDDLPGQPKGIFVTKTGYQSGAREFAEGNGILLYEFRKPNDDDWKDRIKTIVIEMNLISPRFEISNLNVDKEWLLAEKMKLGLSPEHVFDIPPHMFEMPGNCYDANLKVREPISDHLQRLVRGSMEELPTTTEEILFSEATFIKTYLPQLPFIKLRGIEVRYSVHRIPQTIKIDGENVVGFILRNVVSGDERKFDKNLKLYPDGQGQK